MWLPLLKSLFDASGTPAAEFALGAIEALLVANGEQIQILRRTEGKVDDLLHGPLAAGITWLDEARQPHRSEEERNLDVERAKECFVAAQAQLHGHTKAVSQVYVAAAYFLGGHATDGARWLAQARDTADGHIREAVLRAEALDHLVLFTGKLRRGIEEATRAVEQSGPLVEHIGEVLGGAPVVWTARVRLEISRVVIRGTLPPKRERTTFRRNDEVWECMLPA